MLSEAAESRVREIIDMTAEELCLKPEIVLSPCRLEQVVVARHIAMILVKESMPLNDESIGNCFNRTRSNVIKCRETMYRRIKDNHYVSGVYLRLKSLINKNPQEVTPRGLKP